MQMVKHQYNAIRTGNEQKPRLRRCCYISLQVGGGGDLFYVRVETEFWVELSIFTTDELRTSRIECL